MILGSSLGYFLLLRNYYFLLFSLLHNNFLHLLLLQQFFLVFSEFFVRIEVKLLLLQLIHNLVHQFLVLLWLLLILILPRESPLDLFSQFLSESVGRLYNSLNTLTRKWSNLAAIAHLLARNLEIFPLVLPMALPMKDVL